MKATKWAATLVATAMMVAGCGGSEDGASTAVERPEGTGQEESDAASSRRADNRSSRISSGDDEAEPAEGATMGQDALENARDTGSDDAAPRAGQAPPRRIDRPEEPELIGREPAGTTFQDYGTNPFVDTLDDHESTFALDVDTASYTIARSWIEQGVMPDPDSVRVEEFVNYFDQDYSPPRDDVFAVYADGAPHPYVDDDTYLVRLGIAAEEIFDRHRDPARLTFVVDVSGSMTSDGRLETVKEALHLLVDELDGGDEIAIVAYDDVAWEVLSPTVGDDRRRIHSAIDELWPGGSTNAEAGLALGYELARSMFDDDASNRVVLASDGVANVGDASADGILGRIAEDAGRGIHLTAIGVGFGNFNDVLLEQLADRGNGNYAYVDSIEEARRVFVDDLVGTLQTVAQDAKVQIEFDPDAVVSYRLIGFENRDLADDQFRNDRVDAGEIGAGHTVTALYELELARGVDPGDGTRLGVVNLRWSNPGTRDASEITGNVTTDVLWDDADEASAHFRLTATVATFAEVLRESRYVRGVSFATLADAADGLARELRNDADAGQFADLLARVDRMT